MFVFVSVMHFFGCMIGKLSEQWLTEQWLAKAMLAFPKRDHHKTFVLSYLKRSFRLKTSGVNVPFWAQRIKSIMTEPISYCLPCLCPIKKLINKNWRNEIWWFFRLISLEHWITLKYCSSNIKPYKYLRYLEVYSSQNGSVSKYSF